MVGFKAQNHPQQSAKRGAVDHIDDRRTPPEVVAMAAEMADGPFTLDVAASSENAQCADFYTLADDGLAQSWHGRVWCNPPYSDCAAWVRKASDEWATGRTEAIAMLLPANRTEQAWWQDYIEPNRGPWDRLRVKFLRGRTRFGHPEGWQVPVKGDRPPFGLCLVVWA